MTGSELTPGPETAMASQQAGRVPRATSGWAGRLILLPALGSLLLLWLWPLPSTGTDAGRSASAASGEPVPGITTPASLVSSPLTRGAREASCRDAPAGEAVLSAVAAAAASNDPELRSQALEALLDALDRDEGYRLLSLMAVRPPGEGSGEFVVLLLHHLADADAGGLEQWARGLQEGPMRTAAFTAVALQRSEGDAPGAMAWARGLGTSSAETTAALQVATELGTAAPTAALDLAAALPASPERDQCLAHCVAQWAAVEPSAAATWAGAVEDEELRSRLLSRVVTAMADQDPWAAADLTAVALPPGPVQASAAVAVAQRWAQRDPEAARSWAAGFPDTRLREDVRLALEQVSRGRPRPGTTASD